MFLFLLLFISPSLQLTEQCICNTDECQIEATAQLKRRPRIVDDIFPGTTRKAIEVQLLIRVEEHASLRLSAFLNESSVSVDWHPASHDVRESSRLPPILANLTHYTNAKRNSSSVLLTILFDEINVKYRSMYLVEVHSLFHAPCHQILRLASPLTMPILFACEEVRGADCTRSIQASPHPICGLLLSLTHTIVQLGKTREVDVQLSIDERGIDPTLFKYLIAYYGACDSQEEGAECLLRYNKTETKRFCLPESHPAACDYATAYNVTVSPSSFSSSRYAPSPTRLGVQLCAVRDRRHERAEGARIRADIIQVPPIPSASLLPSSPTSKTIMGYGFLLGVLLLFSCYVAVHRCLTGRIPFTATEGFDDAWEMDECAVKVTYEQRLGCGRYGAVYLGSLLATDWQSPTSGPIVLDDHKRIAVKIAHPGGDLASRQQFIDEIEANKAMGYHPRIVNLLGVITTNDPLCMITEYCAQGDLRTYLNDRYRYLLKLRDLRQDPLDTLADCDRDMLVSKRDALRLAVHVCNGMDYLRQRGFVHRSLSSKTVMVTADGGAKISDFGKSSVGKNDGEYYRFHSSGDYAFSIKFMAPEVLRTGEHTLHSDIYSFGSVLFSLATLGGVPYPSILPSHLLSHLNRDRQPRPVYCEQKLYEVMLSCWRGEGAERPGWSQLCDQLMRMGERAADQIVQCDFSADYYIGREHSEPPVLTALAVIREDDGHEEEEEEDDEDRLLSESKRLLGFQ